MSLARPVTVAATLLTLPLAGALAACEGDRGLTATPGSESAPVSASASASASAPTKASSPSAGASDVRPSTSAHAARSIFAGKVIGIDPGHNGGNRDAPGVINRPVSNGVSTSPCNTTGTATDDGYPEADFTWAVANDLASSLRRLGAKVVMTRTSNTGVGPCIDKRARTINNARADVAIDIHADGAPAADRGFSMLVPVPTRYNKDVVGPSRRYAGLIRREMRKTGMPVATYLGKGGYVPRDDLAGLNLTTVPQVLLEIGNMRNAQDARLHRSQRFQKATAAAIERAMAAYLTSR